jgi:hypothetical protein
MKMATLQQGRKVLELIEKIPAEQLQKLIERGYISDLLKADMNKMNRGEFRKSCGLTPIFIKFPVWKTIKLGTRPKTADEFRRAIKDHEMGIGDWANDILKKPEFRVTEKETEIDLVLVTGAELGFENRTARQNIYRRALDLD